MVPGRQLNGSQVVEGVGFAEPVAEVAVQRQGVLLAGGRGRGVPGRQLNGAQVAEGVGPSRLPRSWFSVRACSKVAVAAG